MGGGGRLFVARNVFPPSPTSPPAVPVEVTAPLQASQNVGASLRAGGPQAPSRPSLETCPCGGLGGFVDVTLPCCAHTTLSFISSFITQ